MTISSLKKHDGSITVEAAVIIPIVIIAVMVVLYIALVIFQICVMQITANKMSERIAATWLNQYSAFDTGRTSKSDIEKLGLYRRWKLGNSTDSEELQAAAASMVKRTSILKGKDIKVDIRNQNSILTQRIVIDISANYSNPLGGLTGSWGMGRSFQLKVQSQAVIDDPVEFMRNSDFILETASAIPVINQFESKWKEIVDRIVEYINSLSKGEKTN